MDFDTAGNIAERVLIDLSMVPGTGTQRYADDRVLSLIIDGYLMLSRKQWWKRQMAWYTRTLDGTTGVITEALDDVRSFEDIKFVLRDTDTRPLPHLPEEWNPYAINGTRPKYVEPYEAVVGNGKHFRVWPSTATGTVRIRARKLLTRADIGPDTLLNFDEYAIRCWACWHYSEADAASPGQSAMFQSMLQLRVRDMQAAESEMPIELDPRGYEESADWQEAP